MHGERLDGVYLERLQLARAESDDQNTEAYGVRADCDPLKALTLIIGSHAKKVLFVRVSLLRSRSVRSFHHLAPAGAHSTNEAAVQRSDAAATAEAAD